MGEWSEPNGFSAVFRLTSSKYADAFVDKGSIKFNTPNHGLTTQKIWGWTWRWLRGNPSIL